MQQSLADSMANAPSMDPPDFDVGAKPGGLFAGLSDAIGPKGAKGLAEAPNVATAAAISNAIAKLVGGPVRQLPMTAERVWDAMQTNAAVVS